MCCTGSTARCNAGEVVTLLGRNGAGRTTLLRAILGLVGARSGSVCVNGTETIGLPTHRIAHLGIGYCPEERGIYASLSTEENLLLPPVLAPGGMSLEEIYALFPQLAERRSQPRHPSFRRRTADAGAGADSAQRRAPAAAR